MRLSVSLCFLILSLISSHEVRAQVPLFDEPGRDYDTGVWNFSLQSTYYEANANYTEDGGQFVSLPSGYSYNLLLFDFGARWVPRNQWAVYVSSQIANATSENATDTRKNSSLTQALIGTDFILASWRRFELAPDFSLLFPFDRIDPTQDHVLNHEGAIQASGRILAKAQFGVFHPFGFAGLTYRDEGRSTLLPYGLGAELQFTNWIFGGELRGYQTVANDKYSNEPNQREVVAANNGGAMKFYAIDPSLVETNFWLKKKMAPQWDLKLGGGTSITGANTAAGWNVIAGLSYSFKPAQRSRSRISPPEEHLYFREETNDGVDQELFRRPPPPPPVPKELTTEQQRKKLQKELNQTEFQIELKRTKTKKKKR